MQALTNRAKSVDRKPMSFLEQIYLWNIMKGMIITFKHMFKKVPTIQYPEEKDHLVQFLEAYMF
jgi:NADH-quinone oxidoreductase subunit I